MYVHTYLCMYTMRYGSIHCFFFMLCKTVMHMHNCCDCLATKVFIGILSATEA